MSFKFPYTLLFLILCLTVSAQEKQEFGKLTEAERTFTTYLKDPDAAAVVLYEVGDNRFRRIKDLGMCLVKKYHAKIKILKSEGFEKGNIKIPLLQGEKIKKLKAITHNKDNQYELSRSEIYTTDFNNFISAKQFAFPNLEVGSIIEYTYEITTPHFYKLDGWEFQSDIPKLYSEFNAKIPDKYIYNRVLVGSLKLDTNDAHHKKKCFRSPSYTYDCEILKYTMKDIPALRANEDFSLASSNYASRLEFELAEIHYDFGGKNSISESWDEIDKKFRRAAEMLPQSKGEKFLLERIPNELLLENDNLKRAKGIFSFVKNHFTWDETKGFYLLNDLDEAYNQKKGSTAEINLTLINLLQGAHIDANLMISSTRENGLPKKVYPSMVDFNYTIARVEIDKKVYLLDASNKYNSFGMLPFKALNHFGRVMDLNEGSYWQDIQAYETNKNQVRTQITFDTKSKEIIGALDILHLGYDAFNVHKLKDQTTEEEYINLVSDGIQENIEMTSYQFIKERSTDSKVAERLGIRSEFNLDDRIYFNPFLIKFFDNNPFQSAERKYPIDFGYTKNYKYQVNIKIPEGYQIQELPKDKAIELGDKMALLRLYSLQDESNIMLSFELAINSSYFSENDYSVLQEIFKQAIIAQNNSLLVFKRK